MRLRNEVFSCPAGGRKPLPAAAPPPTVRPLCVQAWSPYVRPRWLIVRGAASRYLGPSNINTVEMRGGLFVLSRPCVFFKIECFAAAVAATLRRAYLDASSTSGGEVLLLGSL